MQNEKVCPRCGSNQVRTGYIPGVRVQPLSSKMSLGAGIDVELCSECGEIFSFKVDKPQRFK